MNLRYQRTIVLPLIFKRLKRCTGLILSILKILIKSWFRQKNKISTARKGIKKENAEL